MSSSIDPRLVGHASRTQVLRNAATRPMPALLDLETLSGPASRAVDPQAVAEAVARGYDEGRAQGYEDGYASGHQAALDQATRADASRAEAFEVALSALARATADLDARDRADLAEIEQSMVEGALELAAAVLGRELEVATDPGRDALARALQLAEGREPVLARLNPEDLAVIGEFADLAPGREITLVGDAGIERGGCILEIGDGRIDARLAPALDRVRQVLAR